ncbi:MAG: hypothetical protein ACJAWV_004261 [Flammeovirgaceae bacterium]|jgi:hypothetical protein
MKGSNTKISVRGMRSFFIAIELFGSVKQVMLKQNKS